MKTIDLRSSCIFEQGASSFCWFSVEENGNLYVWVRGKIHYEEVLSKRTIKEQKNTISVHLRKDPSIRYLLKDCGTLYIISQEKLENLQKAY